MAKRQFLIVGNWKMYPQTRKEASTIFGKLAPRGRTFGRARVVVALPYPYLALFRRTKTIALGAQDVFWVPEGSFTGEVSGPMLRSFNVRYVIIGHSERRIHLGETDDMVAKKLQYALSARLRPIVCVGETKRDADGAFFAILKRQVESAFAKVRRREARRAIIAYEPVWAIGSGRPAHPKDAAEAALFIKKILADRYGVGIVRKILVLYGGSVDAQNAAAFLAEREIGGLLVGRGSRKPKEFLEIIKCVRSVS